MQTVKSIILELAYLKISCWKNVKNSLIFRLDYRLIPKISYFGAQKTCASSSFKRWSTGSLPSILKCVFKVIDECDNTTIWWKVELNKFTDFWISTIFKNGKFSKNSFNLFLKDFIKFNILIVWERVFIKFYKILFPSLKTYRFDVSKVLFPDPDLTPHSDLQSTG